MIQDYIFLIHIFVENDVNAIFIACCHRLHRLNFRFLSLILLFDVSCLVVILACTILNERIRRSTNTQRIFGPSLVMVGVQNWRRR